MIAPAPPETPSRQTDPTLLLLTRLTVAFSRRRSYPAKHPLVKTAELQAFETLTVILDKRRKVALSVGQDELLLDGDVIEHGGSLAADLADKLRNCGVSALIFDAAVTLDSLQHALTWLARDLQATNNTDASTSAPPTMSGIGITRIAYDKLELAGTGARSVASSSDIWRLLASTALLNDSDLLNIDGLAQSLAENARRVSAAVSPAQPGASNRVGAIDGEAGDVRDDDVLGGASYPTTATAAGDALLTGPRVAYGGADTPADEQQRSTRTAAVGATGAAEGIRLRDGLATSGMASGAARTTERSAHDNASATTENSDEDVIASASPTDVAGAIDGRIAHEGYAQRISQILSNVAEQIARADDESRLLLGERLRSVLGSIHSSSLSAIIQSAGEAAAQRQFISQVVQALPVATVVEWLETAAHASGQDLSHQLLRMLNKLATRSDASSMPGRSESAFRGAAQELVAGWTLDNPSPADHIALLDHISVYDSAVATRVLGEVAAVRVVQLALEVDVFGEDAIDGARRLVNDGRVADLLTWMEEAPGRTAAAALHAFVLSPESIKAVLLAEPFDQGDARALLANLHISASHTLLDVLRDATGRTARRMTYDRLREFGPDLSPHLLQRLEGAPWYFVRNLLALLRDVSVAEAGSGDSSSSAMFAFLNHPQEQVRLEALRLLVNDPATRDASIRRVLSDQSDRIVRVALDALASPDTERRMLTPELVQRLLMFVRAGTHHPDLLVRAVRTLHDAPPSNNVHAELLALTTRRTLVLRRLRLAEGRPVMLAALEVIAARYANNSTSRTVMALARRDRDASVRNAVNTTPASPVIPLEPVLTR